MKHFSFLFFATFLSISSFSQAVVCDLGLSNNAFKGASGGSIDANNLSVGQVGQIQVAINNFSQDANAPAGHFQVIIGLGAGLILNPTYNLATAPLSNYFNWSYDISGSQPQIIGTSIATLPAGFADLTYFEFKANSQTTSTASFNFLISNPPGTTTPLSDPNTANNSAGNPYTVNGIILPVNFTGVAATTKDCNINVNWNVKTEENLSRYEVEVSKDGIAFSKIVKVIASNHENYNSSFPITDVLKAPTFYIRVKAIDKDEKSMYSSIVTTKGLCNSTGKLSVLLYPNPVQSADFITIQTTEGVFNGKYIVSLADKSGKVYERKSLEFNNLTRFNYSLGKIASGTYSIIINGDSETNSAIVGFTKL